MKPGASFRITTKSDFLTVRLGPGPWAAVVRGVFGPDSWQGSPDVRAVAFRTRLVEDRQVPLETQAYDVVVNGFALLLVFASELTP